STLITVPSLHVISMPATGMPASLALLIARMTSLRLKRFSERRPMTPQICIFAAFRQFSASFGLVPGLSVMMWWPRSRCMRHFPSIRFHTPLGGALLAWRREVLGHVDQVKSESLGDSFKHLTPLRVRRGAKRGDQGINRLFDAKW